ncbi:MAG: bifunctional precorrin-2 dehydrogenase/sirohydrochlorin ferrochelatase [Lentilactobacillus diolivorans]|jgi:precorrin-2 dehydrogenase/sirohydrochlorin ferrochelatase|nr:bifunctional precorrin-2 dehydrogenase/sirohydrochlorin ferrochelatase [Lentilactobacillus diolivorans]RRG02487.1 MAG: bifunctional precorrin-2 dehydrogenase/sirohydrochlorin ferrochelatase [Lactobacillus sp.]
MDNPYPVNLDLTKKAVAVIGGGKVAARKIKALVNAKAHVTVISPVLDPKIDQTTITWIRKAYAAGDIRDMDVIIACTNNPAVNQQVTDDASHFQWVNNTSDKTQSDFYNVAQIETDQLLLTISTKGHSPATAKHIKKELLTWLKSQKWFGEGR